MRSLADRRIVVVGGASGIGRAIAAACVDEGASVVVADRDEEGGRSAVASVGGEGFDAVDVADEDSVRTLFAALGARWSGLDGLVNTAGILRVGALGELAIDDWERLFAVNAGGQFLVLKHALPLLGEGDAPAVVTLGSAAGLKGGPGVTAYSATKGAVIAFSRAAAVELAPLGIRVNALCPGWVDTSFNQPAYDAIGGPEAVQAFVEQSVPLGRQARPDEVAGYAAFLLSPAAGYATGQAVIADGGML